MRWLIFYGISIHIRKYYLCIEGQHNIMFLQVEFLIITYVPREYGN